MNKKYAFGLFAFFQRRKIERERERGVAHIVYSGDLWQQYIPSSVSTVNTPAIQYIGMTVEPHSDIRKS